MARRLFTWEIGSGSSRSTMLVVNKTQFGDGYAQTTSAGINNVRTGWQVNKFGYQDEIDAIHDFLVEHKGVEPFDVVLSDGRKPYITDGEITVTHVGGDVWQISFTLKREFVL